MRVLHSMVHAPPVCNSHTLFSRHIPPLGRLLLHAARQCRILQEKRGWEREREGDAPRVQSLRSSGIRTKTNRRKKKSRNKYSVNTRRMNQRAMQRAEGRDVVLRDEVYPKLRLLCSALPENLECRALLNCSGSRIINLKS